jgi:hypothetical protein
MDGVVCGPGGVAVFQAPHRRPAADAIPARMSVATDFV